MQLRVSRFIHATSVKLLIIGSVAVASAALTPDASAKHRHWKRDSAEDSGARGKKAKAPEAAPAGPLFMVVSIGKQHVSVYDAHGALVARAPVSTGMPGHRTPMGLFNILEKEWFHRSNLYSAAPMPFMQRVTWSGVAMHAGVLPGYPASHGCIRMPGDFAKRLYGMTKGHEHVLITHQDVEPAAFSHPRLPAPKFQLAPSGESVASGSAQVLQNAISVTEDGRSPVAGAEKVDVAVKAEGNEAKAEAPARRLVNPVEYARLMKAQAASKIDAATAAAKAAAKTSSQKSEELAAARLELRKADIALSNAKDRAESIERRAKRVLGDESSQALSTAKAAAETAAKEAEDRVEAARKAVDEKTANAAEKPDELSAAKIELRKAEAALSNAKDRLGGLERRAKRVADEEQAFAAAKSAADAAIKEAEARIEAARRVVDEKTAAQAEAAKAAKEAEEARKAASDGVKFWARRAEPISIFISRKTERLYVRQGFAKLFDVPVKIRDPQTPIGTHLFLATQSELNSDQNGATLHWFELSAPSANSAADDDDDRRGRKRRRGRDEENVAPQVRASDVSASAALDRIEIPDEVSQKISEHLWTGASLIVSDNGLSHETGDGTGFVVQTR